jgi:methyl halide transferase
MQHLSKEFWSQRYQESQIGWDLGEIAPPIKAYFDQIEDKNLEILIPGCGNGYEAEYLFRSGFKNVHVIDFAQEPLDNLKERITEFPSDQIHKGDFFEHKGLYDIIVEQTMFCAIDPNLRSNYAETASRLLKPGGKLVGVLFNVDFESGPPYGGTKEEYKSIFKNYFSITKMEECYNSVQPRLGNELFIDLKKM